MTLFKGGAHFSHRNPPINLFKYIRLK